MLDILGGFKCVVLEMDTCEVMSDRCAFSTLLVKKVFLSLAFSQKSLYSLHMNPLPVGWISSIFFQFEVF